MDYYQVFWAALQQSVWIGYGPGLLFILAVAIAGVVAVTAWDLAAALFREYFG